MLKVIEGGLSGSLTDANREHVGSVAQEGQRRLREAGIDRYEAREKVTGVPIPAGLRIFKLQIEFAVEALSTLSPLPADYESDGYWPAKQQATPTGVACL